MDISFSGAGFMGELWIHKFGPNNLTFELR